MVTVVVSSSSICCEALRPAIKSARQIDLAPDVLSSFNLRATEKNFRFFCVDNSDEMCFCGRYKYVLMFDLFV
jgi:hypothetical protein